MPLGEINGRLGRASLNEVHSGSAASLDLRHTKKGERLSALCSDHQLFLDGTPPSARPPRVSYGLKLVTSQAATNSEVVYKIPSQTSLRPRITGPWKPTKQRQLD